VVSPIPDSAATRTAGVPIDPTANVIALVEANAKFQEKYDALVASFNRSELRRLEQLMLAERRRVDDLAAMKDRYDKQISETQTTQLKTTSDLVSATQNKMEGALSETISKEGLNTKAMLETLDKRMAAVEQFRYETGGAQGRQGVTVSLLFNLLSVAGVIGLIIVDFLRK
jgi:flagellin-like hook-associated protein FlgL